MLIPHLHFNDNCKEAILLYEKAFNVKVDSVILNSGYAPEECKDDDRNCPRRNAHTWSKGFS